MSNSNLENRLKFIRQNHDERSDKYLAILKGVDDTVALILKGHLVVEELLTMGIAAHCCDSSQLEKAGLRFSQKIALFRALERIPFVPDDFWNSIIRLNRLRNELAHNLDEKKIPKLAGEFVSAVEKGREKGRAFPIPHEGREALSQALHYLIGALEVLAYWQEGAEELVLRKLSED